MLYPITPGPKSIEFKRRIMSSGSLAFAKFSAGDAAPAWLGLSRAGPAMEYAPNGELTFAPNNQFLYSNAFQNAAWSVTGPIPIIDNSVVGPTGATDATSLQYAVVDFPAVFQAPTIPVGTNALFAIWARGAVGGEILNLYGFDNGGGYAVHTVQTFTLTTTWTRYYIKATATAQPLGFAFGYFSTFGGTAPTLNDIIYVSRASYELVTYETAPRDYNGTTSAAYQGPRYGKNPSTVNYTPAFTDTLQRPDMAYGDIGNGWTVVAPFNGVIFPSQNDSFLIDHQYSCVPGGAASSFGGLSQGVCYAWRQHSENIKRFSCKVVWKTNPNGDAGAAEAAICLIISDAQFPATVGKTIHVVFTRNTAISIGYWTAGPTLNNANWQVLSTTQPADGTTEWEYTVKFDYDTGLVTAAVNGHEFTAYAPGHWTGGTWACCEIYAPATGGLQPPTMPFVTQIGIGQETCPPLGLIVESSRTNAIVGPNTAAAWNSSANVTTTENAFCAPDGTSTALKVVANTDSYTAVLQANVNTVGAVPYTHSVYLRDGSVSALQLIIGNTSFGQAANGMLVFNDNGLVFDTPGVLKIEYVRDGWYRVSKNYTPAADGIAYTVLAAQNINGVFYTWNLQVEAGAFASSVILPNLGGVARPAETLSAASYGTEKAIIQYVPLSTGTRARKLISPFSGISSETDEIIEQIALYPASTDNSLLTPKLVVGAPL